MRAVTRRGPRDGGKDDERAARTPTLSSSSVNSSKGRWIPEGEHVRFTQFTGEPRPGRCGASSRPASRLRRDPAGPLYVRAVQASRRDRAKLLRAWATPPLRVRFSADSWSGTPGGPRLLQGQGGFAYARLSQDEDPRIRTEVFSELSAALHPVRGPAQRDLRAEPPLGLYQRQVRSPVVRALDQTGAAGWRRSCRAGHHPVMGESGSSEQRAGIAGRSSTCNGRLEGL